MKKTRSKFKLSKLYVKEERGPLAGRGGGRGGVGQRGPRKRPRKVSDYGTALREKQKVRFEYGLRERPFANYVSRAASGSGEGDAATRLYTELETRLDSVVYRLGFAPGRPSARQLVSHGHITVNGRRVDVPSYRVRTGNIIGIRSQSREKGVFSDLDLTLKKHTAPTWLALDAASRTATVIGAPSLDEAGLARPLGSIIEYYSR